MALRERKKEQTRLALFEAALRLASAQGFEATTVDQIAEESGVSRRTFFRYFPSKEAVFFPHQEERIGRFQEALQSLAGDRAFTRIKKAFLSLAKEYMAQRKEIIRQQEAIETSTALLGFELKMDKEWELLVSSVLLEELGESRRFEAEIQAGAIIGVIRATLRNWYQDKGEQDLVCQGEQVFNMLANGFGQQAQQVGEMKR